jgi:hypothetical protein
MQVTKLRATADANGLVPAGTYFSRLARQLEDANVRESAVRARLDQEDRELEARYRRASGARDNTFVHAA